MKKNTFPPFFLRLFLLGCVLVALCAPTDALPIDNTTPPPHAIGDVIDSYNGVAVHFNGPVGNVTERNVAPNGYNLGQKYQCVEFVKRYYYHVYNHEMPDSYGNAKDFFDSRLPDGGFNKARSLLQFVNGGLERPQTGHILIFGPASFNRFGHVAIVNEVTPSDIEYIQQNPGPKEPSRKRLTFIDKSTTLKSSRLLGWLRKQ